MNNAIILTTELFEDLEVFVPLYRLKEIDWNVDIATPDAKETAGKHGYRLKPQMKIDDVDPVDYDVLILPGGPATAAASLVRRSVQAHERTQAVFLENKPVAAICHGPYTLISAGVINGRRLTSVPKDGVTEEIKKAGGIWEDEDVVDGDLITSRTPHDLPVFTRELVRMLTERQRLAPGFKAA